MSDQDELQVLGQRWAAAEIAGDTETLAAMAHPDFRLVGPAGFILDRDSWLDRYRSGDLTTTELLWDQTEIRVFDDTAISIGQQHQRVAYRGHANDGDFRITHLFLRDRQSDHGWVIAGIHLSPMMQPGPGAADRTSGGQR